MNTKRLLVAFLAVFVVVFFYDWGFHGYILRDAYIQSASLWRPETEMMRYFGWLVLGQFLLSVMFCLIYANRYTEPGGVGPGIGYGLMAALLLSAPTLITYAVQPMPLNIIGAWFIGETIKLMIAGAILGAIYRPKPSLISPPGQPVPA